MIINCEPSGYKQQNRNIEAVFGAVGVLASFAELNSVSVKTVKLSVMDW